MSASYWLEALDQAGYRAMCYLLAVLWQSSILLVVTAGLAWLLRRRRAAVRHALWMLALTVTPLLPLLTSAARQADAPQAPLALMPAYEAPAPAALAPPAPRGGPAIHESALPPAGPAPDPAVQPAPAQAPAHPASFADNIMRYPWSLALLAYAAGLVACLSLLVIGRLHIRQWVRSGRPAADDRLERAFAQASALLKLRGRVEVLICGRVPAPLSLGLRHPRILLPDDLIARLADEELLAVALHELAHVRRRDPLLLTLATLVRAVFFFHPLVWVAVRQVSALAELCADDAVLEATGAPLPYAKMLARLAEELPPRPLSTEMATGLLFSKGSFLRRVEAILGDRSRIRRLSRLALAGTITALVVTLALALALPLEEGYKASGEVVNGLQVSIEPEKKSYGLDEPILVHWRIKNVGNKAQTILWHQEQQHLPVAFRYGKKGEKQTIQGNMLAAFIDHPPVPPEKILLEPGQTKEAILDLRQFSMGHVEKDNKNLGMYRVAGLYTLKDMNSIISSYLAQPEYRDVFAGTVVSGDVAIELTDDLSWLKAQLSYGDVFKSIEAARRLAPLIGNEAVLVDLEKMYPTDNTRHMLRLVDVMAELGERSHIGDVLDMVEAGGYTPHLIDYGEDMLDFLLRWGEKRGVEYLQRYLIERPAVGYTNALERDRSALLRKITDIKTVKQEYLPLLIISLKDRDTPTPNADERWCDKAGLVIQKLLGRDWGLGLEQTVEERDGIIGRMRAELADRVPALAERKQRVRFVERADGDEGGGYSNGLRLVANPVKRAVKQGEDIAFDLFVVNSGEPFKLFCIYPDTDWRWTSVVLQTSIGKRVEMTPPEPKAAPRPIEKEDFVAIPPEKTIYWGRQTISQDWILPGGLPPGEHTFFVSLDKTDKMETTIPGYKEFREKRFLHPWNGTPIAMTRSVTVVYDEKQAGAACWLEGSCTNKFPMNGRWNISRAKPVAVVVGWYAFDESGLVDHGGIATQTAASAVPLDLLFGVRLYEGGLTLETSLNRIEKESDAGWSEPGRSASATDDIAVPSAPVLRTANPALKTTSLDALTSFGETLQPLWKVEIPRDGKSKLTLVYAVRALPEDAPVRLFDPDNPAEALRVGREWSGLWPVPYPSAKAKLDFLADLPEFHDQNTAAAPRAGGPPSDGVRLGAADNQPLALGLAPALELNKSTYDIGEPIIASLVLKNVAGRKISLETGSDGRSGRAERFRFHVANGNGKVVPDPLKIFVSSNLAGGLGGGVDLAPGETYTVTALLNLYAAPRAPGSYTVSGEYQLIQGMDSATSGRLTLPPVTFRVGSESSGMSQEQGRALFSKYKLDWIHPCILYGLQNNTGRIPQLIAMMEPKTPTPREDPFASLADRNASFDAMESLVLMPEKAAVYRAIEKEIAARWPNSSSKYDYLFLPLGHIYRTAITPETVPIIEPSLDHANAAVADLAFLTALSMGSAKALDRLPAALRSTDSSRRQFARQYAFQYLDRALSNTGMAIEGVPTQLVPKYGDALMEGFRQEEGDPARADTEAFPDILPFGYLLEFHFAHYRLWDAIGIAVESNSPLKHTAALRYLAKCGENTAFPPLEKDQIARLIPFARRQIQTHPDARARALAMRCLALWGDKESIPTLTQALDAPEKPLRLAAAEALILLHHGPLLEKCIERLVEEDEARDPKHVIWVAQRLGMKNAGQSFQLRLPGSEIPLAGGTGVMSPIRPGSAGSAVATPSVQETRDRWKATLRHLIQASYQQAQTTSSVNNADHATSDRVAPNPLRPVSNEGPLNSQHSDSSTSITRLIGIMTDRDRDWNKERIPAQKALAKMGALAVPKLIELLKFDPNESPPDSQHAAPFGYEKAYMACCALAKIGPAAAPAIPQLVPLLTDHDDRHVMSGEYLSFTAMEALGAIGKASIPALRPYLKNEDLRTRVFALYAINQMKGDTSDAIPDILPLLKDSLPAVRASAAESLGRMGPKAQSAIPYLKPLLRDTAVDDSVFQTGTVKDHAVKAIKRIEGADPEYSGDERVAAALQGLRAVAGAMEGHKIDNNAYPKTLFQLTTPVAYLSALPEDPFATSDTQKLLHWKPDAKPAPLLYSVGPDRLDQGGALVYDPTNGATSAGDIVRALKPGEAKSYEEIHGAALGKQIQQDAPTEDLIKALESDNINQWSRATDFLNQRGEKARPAVPALIKALDRPQVRGSAMYALQGIGPAATEAIPAMIKLLEDQPEAQGSGGGPAETLVKIGAAAVPALKEAARPVVNPGDREIARRLWSCAALVKLGETDPAYLRYIGDVMQSKHPFFCYKGLQAVQTVGPKAAALTPELKRMMTEPQFQQQESIKRAIITALLRIGPAASEALPEVISALDAKDSLARIEAIRAVRAIDGEKAQAAIPQLIQALQANDKSDAFVSQQQPRVRAEAAETLRAMGQAARPAMPELIKLLDDPDEWARANAVQAISNIDPTDPQALAGLIVAMRDPEGRVSRAANIALLKTGPVNIEVIRAFIRAVRENAGRFSISGDRTGFVSDIVNASEGFFSQLGPEHRYAVPDLADLARDPHPGVQRLAFQALANIGEVPADLMPTLIASAQENEGYWAAGVVLRKLGPKAAPAAPAMLKILQTENDPRRITALDVLVAIGRPAADPAIPLIEQALQKYSIPPAYLCEALLNLDPGSQAALDGLEKLVANPPKGDIYDIPQAHALLLKHGRNAPEHLEALLKTMNGVTRG